jgi:hypothetical protein
MLQKKAGESLLERKSSQQKVNNQKKGGVQDVNKRSRKG